MSDNHFNIKAPNLYRCNMYRYSSTLSKLYIRVFKGMSVAPSFYLFFSDVGYFEGPMNWEGADFQRQESDACIALMRRVGMVQDFLLDDPETREALMESAHLYTVQTQHTTIRIVAGEAVMLADVPPEETAQG
ncbi:MAG: hypothetical protein AAF787_19435 [Chloroflexota bacterium]